jgi:putative oxidoreductase
VKTYSKSRYLKRQEGTQDVALLVARIALAWIFIYHGSATLFGWFGGPGLDKSAGFFAHYAHLHPGRVFATIAGATELLGSILVVIGLFGRIAALAICGDMVIAMVTVTFRNGLASNATGGGYELNLALVTLAFVVAILGTGRVSLDEGATRLLRHEKPISERPR